MKRHQNQCFPTVRLGAKNVRCAPPRLMIEMDETTQMLKLRAAAAKDRLGDVEGGFPVFLSRWSASWSSPGLVVMQHGSKTTQLNFYGIFKGLKTTRDHWTTIHQSSIFN